MKKLSSFYLINIISMFTVFVGIFIFFDQAHPIIPWDGDDWGTLTTFNRSAFPLWGILHPSRIFPEVSGPLAGHFAAFIVYPINGNYIHSITNTVAFIIALCVTIFYFFLCKVFYLLTEKQCLSIFSSIFMIVLYFFIFESCPNSNYHMLWASNLCTVFYYLLPNLLNSILVCYLILNRLAQKEIKTNDGNTVKHGLFFIFVYFSSFSMLWGCSISAIFSFCIIISYLFSTNKETEKTLKQKIKNIFTMTNYSWCIIVLFIIYCVFEFFGKRSSQLQNEIKDTTWLQNLWSSFNEFVKLALQMNRMFVVFSFGVVLLSFLVYLKLNDKKSEIWRLNKLCLICSVSLAVFYIIAAAKAGPRFASRIESVYGVYFFFILVVVLSSLYLINRYKNLFILFLLVLSIMFFEVTRSSKSYSSGTWGDTSSLAKFYLVNDWIKEIQDADKTGNKTVYINYPDVGIWFGDLPGALLSHNIISKPMKIIFYPSLFDKPKIFPADTLFTIIGKKKNGSIFSDNKEGRLVYGPYIPLLAGKYHISMKGAFHNSISKDAYVDICSNSGANILGVYSLADYFASENDILFQTDLDLSESMNDIEVRLYIGKDDEIRFDSCMIEGLELYQSKLNRSQDTIDDEEETQK